MSRFHIIGRCLVVGAGLGGAVLGLSAGAVAGTMAPLGGDSHGRPALASLGQAPAGLRVAVRNALGAPAAAAGSAVQQAELTASDGTKGDQFGLAVSLSGNTAVVGAPFKNSGTGAAYVFVRSGTTWSQQAKLTLAHGSGGGDLGFSVALSGNTVVVGAPFQSVKRRSTGAAYVFVRSGTTWSQQAELTAPVHSRVGDDLGVSVALSGSTAVVGDPRNNSFTGAAFVFVRSGTTWSRQAKLTVDAHGFQQFFGQSVALSGNTLVAGAPDTAAAYVFVRSGTTWSQQAKLTGTTGDFGSSVALSGTTAVVGSPDENSFTGAAYVFVRSGTTWSQQARLTAAHGAENDDFGDSVTLSGNTAVVGSPGTNSSAGAVYVFARSGTTWSQQARLTAAHGAENDNFGDSVTLSGSTAVVGAPGTNGTGAAYVFANV